MEEETENLTAENKRLSEEYSSMEEIKRDLEEQLQDYMTETSQQVRRTYCRTLPSCLVSLWLASKCYL